MERKTDAFISYTRQHGAELAEEISALLRSKDFSISQDRTHMRGGEDFRRQIATAIAGSQYLVMVLTPDALQGDREVLDEGRRALSWCRRTVRIASSSAAR